MPESTTRTRVPTVALALLVPVVAITTAVVTLAVTTSPSESGAPRDANRGTEIVIADFAYAPSTLRVDAGTTVDVTNDDGARHTLTAVDGSFDTGTLDGGARTTVTVERRGTYRYFCDIHDYMTGRIEAT